MERPTLFHESLSFIRSPPAIFSESGAAPCADDSSRAPSGKHKVSRGNLVESFKPEAGRRARAPSLTPAFREAPGAGLRRLRAGLAAPSPRPGRPACERTVPLRAAEERRRGRGWGAGPRAQELAQSCADPAPRTRAASSGSGSPCPLRPAPQDAVGGPLPPIPLPQTPAAGGEVPRARGGGVRATSAGPGERTPPPRRPEHGQQPQARCAEPWGAQRPGASPRLSPKQRQHPAGKEPGAPPAPGWPSGSPPLSVPSAGLSAPSLENLPRGA
uniref:Uncharacterized protein LOC110192431 n=1 Tax=Phascolarctos cinereus TaxID=38626 RepID=A0A6P5IK56_PHACI|nr:uncharacterized protein LOC110192431 [Phascolarctos cinereus]